MTKTCSTSGWFRHSSRTPSPTMPVAPVMIVLTLMTLDSRHPLVLPMPRRSYLKKCLETPRYQFAPRARCQIQKLTAWKFHRVHPTLKLSQFPHLKKGWRPVMARLCRARRCRTRRLPGVKLPCQIVSKSHAIDPFETAAIHRWSLSTYASSTS